MSLQHALREIAEIRERMASAQVFRGYRAPAAAFSAGLAFVTTGLQSRIVPEPTQDPASYVWLWTAVAVLSLLAAAVPIFRRWHRDDSGRESQRILAALRALAPCLVTGAFATIVLLRVAPDLGWVLPTLWALLFAQGIFASVPLLPRGASWVGAYYVAAGLGVLSWARESQALAGWTMALTFGIGQLLAAGVLSSLERRHAP